MGLFDDPFKKKGIPEKMNILGKEYEVNPDAMVFSQRGLDNYQRQNYPGAVADFTRAINAQPGNQNFYTMRGTAYEDMGNDTEAAKDFAKSLEIHPTDFVASYRMGMVYFRKKDFENAVKWLKVSYANAPDGDLSHIGIGNNNIVFIQKKIITGNLGNFLVQLKRFEEGFKYLDEAIKIDPNYYNPYMVKGMAYAQIGRPKEGIPFLRKAAQLGNQQAAGAIPLLEQLVAEQENSTQSGLELEFVFHSFDHLRYEDGRHVSGPHGGAPRAVKVEANISGNEGYTVTMFNTDGGQAVVQMAPKQMRLQQADSEKIVLRGYGHDAFGASFADYGLTIYHDDGNIEKCVLHMYDRGVDIEYLKSDEQTTGTDREQQNGFEEILTFLNNFRTQPMSAKAALAQKTDELNNTGVRFYERDDIETAIAYYNKALEIYPINDDALKNLVVCYRETGNYKKMQEAQEKLDYLKKLGI